MWPTRILRVGQFHFFNSQDLGLSPRAILICSVVLEALRHAMCNFVLPAEKIILGATLGIGRVGGLRCVVIGSYYRHCSF